jgi:prepilin-type N-terminal cleavage/methylation domain-containing protein
MRFLKNQKGFTFIEILMTMSILTIILGIATMNVLNVANSTNRNTAAETLISDIKSQQIKAMNGDMENSSSNNSYGIYFEESKYILFRGTTYSLSDPSNFIVKLPDDTSFSNILFPNSRLVFTPGSGQIANFNNGSNSVTIQNKQGRNGNKTVSVNRFGAITTVR